MTRKKVALSARKKQTGIIGQFDGLYRVGVMVALRWAIDDEGFSMIDNLNEKHPAMIGVFGLISRYGNEPGIIWISLKEDLIIFWEFPENIDSII